MPCRCSYACVRLGFRDIAALAGSVRTMSLISDVLPQAMHTWRGAVREAAAERAKLRKAAKRMQARSLAAAFSTWEDHATQAQHMRRRELVAQAHQERRLQRVTLRAWQVLALGKQRHHSKTLMVSVMRRLQQRGIAAAFQGWRENAQELVRERRLLARSAARFQRRLLSAAFYRFREAAQSQRLGKKLVARCLARARNHLLAKVQLQDSVLFSVGSSGPTWYNTWLYVSNLVLQHSNDPEVIPPPPCKRCCISQTLMQKSEL